MRDIDTYSQSINHILIEKGGTMKKVILYGVAVAFLSVAGFAGVGMSEEDKGPADITLEVAGSEKPKPAVFPHAKHQETIECDTCHKSEFYKPGAWTKDDGHGLCQECHKSNEDAERAKELKKCTTCHPKAE
jgi:predicted CXXCH cytochrome family protein